MFDLGWSEILVISIVMIIVVGPKDLPRVLRSFGRTTTKLRAMAGDFRRQFDDALREAELDDVKNLVDDVRKLDPRNEIRKHLNPLEQAGRDIKSELDKPVVPKTSPSPKPSEATSAEPAEPLKTGATAMPGEAVVAPVEAVSKPGPTAKSSTAKKTAVARQPAAETVAAPAGIETTPSPQPAKAKAPSARKAAVKTASTKTKVAKVGAAKSMAPAKKRAAPQDVATEPKATLSKKITGSDAQ